MNKPSNYDWGLVDFNQSLSVEGTDLCYAIIPAGYLVHHSLAPADIYLFESYDNIVQYFKKG